jgi:hypothetical protein
MAAILMPIIAVSRRIRADSGPRVTAALAAGIVAGTAAIMLMEWIGMLAYDESPWKLPRMIAALLAGPGALADEASFGAPVLLGFALHYALSLLYALALAGVLAGLRREYAPIVGALFGIALYATNLHGFTHLFPWFAEMRTLDTFVAHAVFGVVAAGAYCEFSRPRGDEEPD